MTKDFNVLNNLLEVQLLVLSLSRYTLHAIFRLFLATVAQLVQDARVGIYWRWLTIEAVNPSYDGDAISGLSGTEGFQSVGGTLRSPAE